MAKNLALSGSYLQTSRIVGCVAESHAHFRQEVGAYSISHAFVSACVSKPPSPWGLARFLRGSAGIVTTAVGWVGYSD